MVGGKGGKQQQEVVRTVVTPTPHTVINQAKDIAHKIADKIALSYTSTFKQELEELLDCSHGNKW